MGVELPFRVVVTILECCVTFSGVKLSIRSFVLFPKYIFELPDKTKQLASLSCLLRRCLASFIYFRVSFLSATSFGFGEYRIDISTQIG